MSTGADFYGGDMGKATVILMWFAFILLIIVIIVAIVCACLWRRSIRFRSYYAWNGQERTLFYDRSENPVGTSGSWSDKGGNLYDTQPTTRSVHTQTDLTAVAVLGPRAPRKWETSSSHGPTPSPRRVDPLPDGKSRWSRINPKLYLNPWTYQKQLTSTPPTEQSPRRVYVEEF